MINQFTYATALRWLHPRGTPPHQSDWALVQRIRDVARQFSTWTDQSLRRATSELRQLVAPDKVINQDNVIVPAFALVVEAARRVLGIELYSVQLLGGLALARGAIAEMQTGEGKTFAAMFPATLHSLAGNGVHVMTVNAYLAGRDYEQLAPVYRLLGLSVGLVAAGADPGARRAAYACDITYGPGYEFGFDYLRDQVALLSRRTPRLGEQFRNSLHGRGQDALQPMQRGQSVAIVDEADSVMIDEAITPLILSSFADVPVTSVEAYETARLRAAQLEIGGDFVMDGAGATLRLTRHGLAQMDSGSASIPRATLDRPWPVYIEQALRAERLFRRDVQYVVADDKIRLVDQNTGRVLDDRSWPDGLHQALQAKEGVTITTESRPIARITRQQYFGLYSHLCGMTGTAQGSEQELRDVYRLQVAVIPTNRPSQRKTLPRRAFADFRSKEDAIAEEVARLHRRRQPVLVGTAAIETSERLARLLNERNIAYQLLNGKQDADESAIIAQAGHLGAVTIATNMAGRGTDIRTAPGVAELGGLHVIATESQASVRVDRQLMGRAARQGDPGSYQLFVSLDDPLLAGLTASRAKRLKQAIGHSRELSPDLSHDIARLQRRAESQHALQRRQVLAHHEWVECVLHDLA